MRGRIAILACLALVPASTATGSDSAPRVPAHACQPARLDRVRQAADHRRVAASFLHQRDAASLGEARRVLGAGRRPVAGLGRTARHLRAQARGRSQDAERRVRHPADDVRRRAEPGRALPLPPHRLRRLVGRGSGVAALQPVPPRALRSDTAVPGRQRGHVPLAGGLQVPGGDRLQHEPGRPGRGSGIFLHVSRGNPTIGCVSLPEGRLLTILRWLRPAKEPLIVIGTRKTIRKF